MDKIFFNKFLAYITEYHCGNEASRVRYVINEFNSLSTEEKVKDLAWYAPYIKIVVRDWPWACYDINHCFTSKEPKVGELCNCKQYAYRKDGYCQMVIEEERSPLVYA